jgi:hypothetical protein
VGHSAVKVACIAKAGSSDAAASNAVTSSTFRSKEKRPCSIKPPADTISSCSLRQHR